MKVAIEIPEKDVAKLRREAERLGLRPEQLAGAAVVDLLNRSDDFRAAAEFVLAKNEDLYRRLS